MMSTTYNNSGKLWEAKKKKKLTSEKKNLTMFKGYKFFIKLTN